MENDYIDWLKKEFLERRSRNFRYSERAFAATLGLSPGFLNLIFQRKKNLSASRAKEVAKQLNWSDLRTKVFVQAVEHKSNRLSNYSIESEQFQEMSDWYYFGIIELLKFEKVTGAVKVQQRLGISRVEAQFALEVLLKANIIKKIGKHYMPTEDEYETPSMTSSAIRKFHRQSLLKAIESIDSQGIKERDLRALTIAFDSTRLSQAAAELARFMKAFERKYSSGKRNSVYQLNFAFHRLTKE